MNQKKRSHKMELVSIIIPVYNTEKYIIETIDSVINQTYANIEIIVIDDGSTDEGASIVNNANMKNVRLVKQANQGVSAARNNRVELASHEYIAFLDADDQWLPLFLDEISRLIVKFPQANFFGTRYQIVESENNYVDDKIKLENRNDIKRQIDRYIK